MRSQVYGGIPVETEATDRAVRETSGQIVTYGGTPARTYYFSSSGGRTASALDVFGTDVPYLQSVEDPWDVASPHHAWPVKVFTPATLARAFGFDDPVADVVQGVPTAPAPPSTGVAQLASVGPATTKVQVVAAGGQRLELGRSDVRSRLGLASTTFRLGMLSLEPPLSSPQPGAVVTINGIARAVDSPTLEKQRPDGSWQAIRALKPLADGSFSLNVQPVRTTVFRVSGSGTAGPTATVVVPAT